MEMGSREITQGVITEFHGVTYDPIFYDSSASIAVDFGNDSRKTSEVLNTASRELAEATRELALAIEEERSFEEIWDCQERYEAAKKEFDDLHHKWVTQATSALRVFREYWTDGQDQD
jgi:hypothetical protein